MKHHNLQYNNIFNFLHKVKDLTKEDVKIKSMILYNHILKNEEGMAIKHDKRKLFKNKNYLKIAEEVSKELEEEIKLFNEQLKINKSPIQHEHKHIIKQPVNRIEVKTLKEFVLQLNNRDVAKIKTCFTDDLKLKYDRFVISFGEKNLQPHMKNEQFKSLCYDVNKHKFGFVIGDTLHWTAKLYQLAFVIVDLKKDNLVNIISINNAVDYLVITTNIISIGDMSKDSLRMYSRKIESLQYKKDPFFEYKEPDFKTNAYDTIKLLIDKHKHKTINL